MEKTKKLHPFLKQKTLTKINFQMKKYAKPTIASLTAAGMVFLMSWMYPTMYHTAMDNDITRSIKEKINSWNITVPEDRVYVQFDKPFYEPGETIWFSTAIRDAATMKPSTKSDMIYVELVNPKGSVDKTIKLLARDGNGKGEFQLDEFATGGMYKVRAYTMWQRNFDPTGYGFEKDIQVQDVILPNLKMKVDFEKKAYGPGDEVVVKLEVNTNENKALTNQKVKIVVNIEGQKFTEEVSMTNILGQKNLKFTLPNKLKSNDGLVNIMIDYNGNTESISRSIPIVLNNIKMEFFPEGGDMVSGLNSNIAFRALNEFGKPADVEGTIEDSKGNKVADFTSFHFGMGSFSMVPVENETYTVKITKPEGVKSTFTLPKTETYGYTLAIDNSKAGDVSIKIGSKETSEVSVIGQVRGKVYYSSAFKVKPGENIFNIPSTNFPMGVAQFTLFNNLGVETCERLSFLNKQKQMKVNITTDKDKYMPREKVNMTISVTDEHGAPVAADLSLAVVNDQLVSFADDRQGHILSKLLLEQDLKQKVEEPNFYFDKKEIKADKALDYLMLTSGWRRFSWQQVKSLQYPYVQHPGERALICGTVYNAYTMKPVTGATLKMVSNGNTFNVDGNGKFIFNKIDLFEPVTFSVSAPEYNAQNMQVYYYNQNQVVYLYPKKPPVNQYYYKDGYYEDAPSVNNQEGEMDMMEMKVDNEVQFKKDSGSGKGVGNKSPKPMSVRSSSAPSPDGSNKTASNTKNGNVVLSNKLVKKEGNINAFGAPKDEKDLDDKRKVKAEEQMNEKFVNGKKQMHKKPFQPVPGNNGFYRSREFAALVYTATETPEVREDFRSTIFWSPNISVDHTGSKTVSFYNSDEITSFRAVVEGVGRSGLTGRGDKVFFTQLPFAMTIKAPVEVATEDKLSIPLTLKNNTSKVLSGLLKINAPAGMKLLTPITELQNIAAGKSKTILLQYEIMHDAKPGDLDVSFKACGLGDAFSQKIDVVSKGYPVSLSYNGSDKNGIFKLNIKNWVKGSLKMKFSAFPSVVGDILTGLDGILREPGGCFEQTSMSSWPNTMVLDYYQTSENKDSKIVDKATDLLKRGYSRLVTFETKDKGYQWFGQAPAHEGLTAYGIMQFNDMKRVGADVDDAMLKRTSDWLLNQKDGKGGFRRNTYAAHAFGMISEDVMNGYITFALAESGYKDMEKELNNAYDKAMNSKDPYQLAMIANAMGANKDSRYSKVMEKLISAQKEDGSFDGTTHSITHSTGQSLTIETTSLAILAMLKEQGTYAGNNMKAVKWLATSRSGYGTFGNTQGTVLALKALTEYAKKSKAAKENGKIELYVDGKKVDEVSYTAGQEGAIEMKDLEKHIVKGNEDIKVKFVDTKDALPYTVSLDYSTSLPNSSELCVVDLNVKLAEKEVKQGETVRLTATITNTVKEGIASPMVVIGIPAGLSVQPWQLKELQEKKMFSFYEIIGNKIALYYTGMAPSDVKTINLDLKAEIPGTYEAPASSAYLYYTNEFKCWTNYGTVTIN